MQDDSTRDRASATDETESPDSSATERESVAYEGAGPSVRGADEPSTGSGSTQAESTGESLRLRPSDGDDALATEDGVSQELNEVVTGEPPLRVSSDLKAIVEALIFASPDPLTPKALFKLLATEPKEDVQTAIAELKVDYERPGGLQLVEVAGGYQIVTRADLHEWVRKLFNERSTQKLSVQSLETLAVIAYKQPITAVEITEIRGVNTSGVLGTLLERHLVKIVGRKQVVGRPFMYATTKEFLIRFGLNDLSDLPKVEDMAAALGLENPVLVEQVPADEQLPVREPDLPDPFDDEPPPGGSSGSIH